MNPTLAHVASIMAMVLLLQGPSAPWQWCLQCHWPAWINIIRLEPHVLSFVGSVLIFTVISLKFTYTMYYSLLRLLPNWFVCKSCLSPNKIYAIQQNVKSESPFSSSDPLYFAGLSCYADHYNTNYGYFIISKENNFLFLTYLESHTFVLCWIIQADLYNTKQRYSIMSTR